VTRRALAGGLDRLFGELPRGVAARVAAVVGGYLFTMGVLVAVVMVLRHQVAPAGLAHALSFYFVATLASALEPGTAKSLLLRCGVSREPRFAWRALIAPTAVKALIASPLLGLAWRLADPSLPVWLLGWVLPLVFSGFVVSDLRVVFDANRQHATAIWVKQGGLSFGLIAFAGILLADGGLPMAIGLSVLLRIGWYAAALLLGWRFLAADRFGLGELASSLREPTWMALAGVSLLAALSGSIDRLAAFRFLEPATLSAYYLIYEVLTKFWILPYLLAPIIFARRAAASGPDRLLATSLRFTALAGAVFMAAAAGLLVAPDWVARVVGVEVGPPVLLFAFAIVLNSGVQLLNSELQARGRSAFVLWSSVAILAISAVALFSLGSLAGMDGLFAAWLIKSTAELLIVGWAFADGLDRPRSRRG